MNKYVIIPGCSDLNRGDQALVWETRRFAEECGYRGEFYLTSERNEPVNQSRAMGLKILCPILEHPSRMFKSKNNTNYSVSLKIKWGIVSVFDFIGSLFILWRPTRLFISFFLSSEKKRTLQTLQKSKAVFVKGGGLLQTYGGLSATYSMYFWVYPVLLAKALKKPVYVMPNSFGPFEGPFVRQIAKAALKKCVVLSSRETYSSKMLQDDLNLPSLFCPDLAFHLPKSLLNREDIFLKHDLPKDRKLVAITMRPYRFPNSRHPEKAYKFFKEALAQFIEWLYEKNFMPVIVEHTLAMNDHENDSACINDVVQMLPYKKYRIISNNSFDSQDLKCIYSFCDYIVGTRFHSVIFSFGNDIPGLAISYIGNKAEGIMHDMELDDYVIKIENVRAEVLKRKFEELLKNEEVIKAKIHKYRISSKKYRSDLIEHCRI